MLDARQLKTMSLKFNETTPTGFLELYVVLQAREADE
jgi:hypothetical protein